MREQALGGETLLAHCLEMMFLLVWIAPVLIPEDELKTY